MNPKMTILMLLSLAPALAGAGNKVGNGGDVVRCAGGVRLLDFYEAEERGTKLIAAPARGEYLALVKSRLTALARVAPRLAAQYRARAERLPAELDFKSDVALTDVQDSLHVFKPADKSCSVDQVVIRKDDVMGSEKRFAVDKRNWEALDVRGRAGLAMHEIVYEHLAKLGATDSRKARRLNALVFSTELDTMTGGKFWLFVKELAVPIYP